MSLYGTGRAEGIGAAVVIGCLLSIVHLLGALQATGPNGLDAVATLRSAAIPALGGVLCYRLLRAQGRSRYSGFLAGTAYAMSPWLCAIAIAPREQLAAGLAPLALEAAFRCGLPPQRSAWLPWTALCIAAPFLGGPSVTAFLVSGLVVVQMAYAVAGSDLGDRTRLARQLTGVALLGGLAAASLLRIDPLGPAFGTTAIPRAAEVLTAHRALGTGIDLPALMRLAGPVLLMFGALGVMRRQRHASITHWLVVAALGTLPLLTSAWWTPSTSGLLALLPVAAWWLPLIAITVLGAAGLDDFLELPLRRRTALPWLLAFASVAAPLIPLVAIAPEREWPMTATILLLALLMPTWRRVGILRFKNVLATATLLALAVPALQVLPAGSTLLPPAAPNGESLVTSVHDVWNEFFHRPFWPYSGLLAVLACSIAAAAVAWRRRIQARPAPSTAKAAIRKKAKPSQRS